MRDFAKKYHALLTGKFKGLNLTRILDFDEFYSKQILDSLLPVEQCVSFKEDIEKSELFIDVGFGGGFPLLVLAKLFPNKQFLGIEARGKKADAVQAIADELGLDNVKAIHHRLEDLLIDKDAIVSFKAVGPLDRCLGWLKTNKNIKAYFYKGPSVKTDEYPKLKNFPEWKMFCEDEIEVPGTNKRYLIGLMLENVPRRTNLNLVKVSDIV